MTPDEKIEALAFMLNKSINTMQEQRARFVRMHKATNELDTMIALAKALFIKVNNDA